MCLTYTYIFTHMCRHTCIHTHTIAQTRMRTQAHTQKHTHTHTCTNTNTHTHKHTPCSGLTLEEKVPSDIDIAQAAACKPITEIFKSAGFKPDEIDLYGKYKAKVHIHPGFFSQGSFHNMCRDTFDNTAAALPLHIRLMLSFRVWLCLVLCRCRFVTHALCVVNDDESCLPY